MLLQDNTFTCNLSANFREHNLQNQSSIKIQYVNSAVSSPDLGKIGKITKT
jgi:hypothetical protein